MVSTKTAERLSRLRFIALAEKHPEFSKSIGLETVPKAIGKTISETTPFREPPAAAAAGKTTAIIREENTMARKIRSDCRIGTLEKRFGLGGGAFRHPSGRDIRSDMKLGTLRNLTKKGKK